MDLWSVLLANMRILVLLNVTIVKQAHSQMFPVQRRVTTALQEAIQTMGRLYVFYVIKANFRQLLGLQTAPLVTQEDTPWKMDLWNA